MHLCAVGNDDYWISYWHQNNNYIQQGILLTRLQQLHDPAVVAKSLAELNGQILPVNLSVNRLRLVVLA